MKQLVAIASVLLLSACGNFEPTEKVASYDPVSQQVTYPAPCPDWSQTTNTNYLNYNHSNFGCAVNKNFVLQLEDKQDMNEGHGINRPDAGITARQIERYRLGEIPQALTPTQASSETQ